MEVMKPAIEVTREELYRQVWETPMSRLAKEYGLSDNGLAKICRRLMVPYPPRGYWAKKAANKPVIQYRLLPSGDDTPRSIVIHPTPQSSPPPAVAEAIQKKSKLRRKPRLPFQYLSV